MSHAIVTSGLSKRYRLGDRVHYGRLTESLANAAGRITARRRPRGDAEYLWALRDVTLEVEQGEVLGFIGRNGAGKSTLLKLLSRITEPTAGEARIRGKVGSLLEVGTGFHPELTGRENVYLSGAILGMRRAETRAKFDQIVEFADVGAFIDTPVKRYSSGMQVRLGFAVAAHLETEILMVDEVLSVGDAEFQRRCLAKIEDVSRGGGRTILFVSHNMQSVRTLCHRAAYLANGELIRLDESNRVVRDYLEHAAVGSPERTWDDPLRRPGDDDIRLVAVRVTDDGLVVEITVDVLNPTAGIAVGFDLESSDGTSLLTSYQLDAQDLPPLQPGLTTFRATLPPSLFDDGSFLISPRIVHHNGVVVAHEQGAVSFDVVNDQGPRGSRHIHRAGPLAVPVAWESENA